MATGEKILITVIDERGKEKETTKTKVSEKDWYKCFCRDIIIQKLAGENEISINGKSSRIDWSKDKKIVIIIYSKQFITICFEGTTKKTMKYLSWFFSSQKTPNKQSYHSDLTNIVL